MPPPIPPILAPYIEHCLKEPSLALLTSVLETPANWLVIRFLLAALHGLDNNELRRSQAQTPEEVSGTELKVVFFSVFRPFDLWYDLGKKFGLDLARLQGIGRVAYIDGLSVHGFISTAATKQIRPKSLTLADIKASVNTAIHNLVSEIPPASKLIIILDGFDFLLASQPDITALEAQQFIASLQDQVHNVVLTCAADAPLLHNVDASATPLELEHSVFARTMAYQSNIVMQMRPLETGHAKDVSGIIRISQHGNEQDGSDEVVDREWLYHLKTDGSARVWSRGE